MTAVNSEIFRIPNHKLDPINENFPLKRQDLPIHAVLERDLLLFHRGHSKMNGLWPAPHTKVPPHVQFKLLRGRELQSVNTAIHL